MAVTPIQDAPLDDAATFAMGEAFDHACASLRSFGSTVAVREIIANRIVVSAKNGERDPARLSRQALVPFGIEDLSMFVVGIGGDSPVEAYASVARVA